MKKFLKVMLVIACVFGVVGIGFSLGGVAMGATVDSVEIIRKVREKVRNFSDVDFDDLDDLDDLDWDDDHEESHHTESGASGGSRVYTAEIPDEIEIKLRYDELILQKYDGDVMKIEVKNDQAGNVKVHCEDKELKISSSAKVRKRSVIVSYPEGAQFAKMEIEVDAGTVELLDDLSVQELDVQVGAGTLENSGALKAKKAEIEVGTGTVALQELTVSELNGECGLGSMELELTGKETDYNYKLECGIGAITIDDEDFAGIVGERKINNPGASGKIELECGMGSITVDFED